MKRKEITAKKKRTRRSLAKNKQKIPPCNLPPTLQFHNGQVYMVVVHVHTRRNYPLVYGFIHICKKKREMTVKLIFFMSMPSLSLSLALKYMLSSPRSFLVLKSCRKFNIINDFSFSVVNWKLKEPTKQRTYSKIDMLSLINRCRD